MQAFGHAIQEETQDGANSDLLHEKLESFKNMPIHCLMSDVLEFRRAASQPNDDNNSGSFAFKIALLCEPTDWLTMRTSDIETYIMKHDRTLFSKLAQVYENAVVQLLVRQEMEGISPTVLRSFQESYASTAFRCRFPHCDRQSLGFATAELRTKHETVHVQRMYCQASSCPYARIGFANKSALNTHTRKHHGQLYLSLIPAKVRRAADAEAESGSLRTAEDAQSGSSRAGPVPVPREASAKPEEVKDDLGKGKEKRSPVSSTFERHTAR